MKTASQILTDFGIQDRSRGRDTFITTCPKCSHLRRKKRLACLSVKLDGRGIRFFCHHCNWKGGDFYEHSKSPDQRPSPGVAGKPRDRFGARRGGYEALQREASQTWRRSRP